MGLFDWFTRKRRRPIVTDAEGKSPAQIAKEILTQHSKDKKLLDEAEKKATVTLEKFDEKKHVAKKPVRTRTIKGRYIADDKSTPDVNEAWEGGKAPKKKGTPKPEAKLTKIRRVSKKKK
jgi:hypothetical protein|tara:strand:- start:168 stop:527 length:360 start_codon:yes stop_codon:yes gene_type:complete